jgi:hypothetical protein
MGFPLFYADPPEFSDVFRGFESTKYVAASLGDFRALKTSFVWCLMNLIMTSGRDVTGMIA